jgi:hypothetical protein
MALSLWVPKRILQVSRYRRSLPQWIPVARSGAHSGTFNIATDVVHHSPKYLPSRIAPDHSAYAAGKYCSRILGRSSFPRHQLRTAGTGTGLSYCSGNSRPGVGIQFSGKWRIGATSYFPEAASRRSRWGSVRGSPVLSSHFSPGFAPQVGQRIDRTFFLVTFITAYCTGWQEETGHF